MLKGSFLFALLAISFSATAKFKVPPLSGPVVDEVGILSAPQKSRLEGQIRRLHDQGLAQVQVYIASSLQGLPIEQASIDIVDQWKLGSQKEDNGVLFLISPNEKKMRIEVGQGLEGIMPDSYALQILDYAVVPLFRQGKMAEGVIQGVAAIEAVIRGDASAPPKQGDKRIRVSPLFFILLWVLLMLLGRRGRRSRAFWAGAGVGGLGGFGRGGLGGGGWSGGGGGFSGGGASGSW